jgi:hypothetical protein
MAAYSGLSGYRPGWRCGSHRRTGRTAKPSPPPPPKVDGVERSFSSCRAHQVAAVGGGVNRTIPALVPSTAQRLVGGVVLSKEVVAKTMSARRPGAGAEAAGSEADVSTSEIGLGPGATEPQLTAHPACAAFTSTTCLTPRPPQQRVAAGRPRAKRRWFSAVRPLGRCRSRPSGWRLTCHGREAFGRGLPHEGPAVRGNRSWPAAAGPTVRGPRRRSGADNGLLVKPVLANGPSEQTLRQRSIDEPGAPVTAAALEQAGKRLHRGRNTIVRPKSSMDLASGGGRRPGLAVFTFRTRRNADLTGLCSGRLRRQ